MIEMSDEFLEINDLDWFATCRDGLLAHFASGGRGAVPLEVRRSVSKHEVICDYFYSLSDETGFEVVENNLSYFKSSAQRDRYLKSFVDMAKRGLFSYDFGVDGYKLIARPKVVRRFVELPDEVREGLCMLPIPISDFMDIQST